jgi:catechol 2,3-dioxygenase-like lactoylglutathione lyase family enzyme
MKVLGLVWLGTRTDRFTEMATFLESTLGLTLVESVDGYREYKLPNADVVELFGSEDTEKTHFTTGPVAGLLVSDIGTARDELRRAGIELIGDLHRSGTYAWQHFRAPDGNVYELVEDHSKLGAVG